MHKYILNFLIIVFYVAVIEVLYVTHSRKFAELFTSVTFPNFIEDKKTPVDMFDIIDENTLLCSLRASKRGKKQRVWGISFFGPTQNKLFQLNSSLSFLYELINEASAVFPAWTIRVYHDSILPSELIEKIENQHANIDFCNMTAHPRLPPKTWRFLPAGDLTVDAMGSRDLDSPFTLREQAAVSEWLSSKKLFHSMRDHPLHYNNMMGGMWGYRPQLNTSLSRLFLQKLRNITLMEKYAGFLDQEFLNEQIWVFAKNDILMHDSYHCARFPNQTRPFPTQRRPLNETNLFVGCIKPCNRFRHEFGPCPVKCRPPEHQDWIYC